MDTSDLVAAGAFFLLLGQLLALSVVPVSRVIEALWSAALVFPSLLIVLYFSERGMGRSLALIAVVYAITMALYGVSLSLSAPSRDSKE